MIARPSRGRLAVVAALLLAVALPSAAQAEPVRSQLTSAGLLPERTPFTQLSIKQYDRLYSTVNTEGNVRFDVVVTNTSTATTTYTWTATIGPQSSAAVVGSGHMSLAAGASKEAAMRFQIPDCLQRNKISVRFSTRGERSPEVHYWVLPHSSAAWKVSGGPSCGI